MDRVAALEREIDFLRQERTLLADQLELEGAPDALSGSALARALSARLATEAAGRAEAEARAEALEEALAAVGLRMEEEEVGPAGCEEAVQAPAPLAPLRQDHQAVAVVTTPSGGGKNAGGAGRKGRAWGAGGESAAPA